MKTVVKLLLFASVILLSSNALAGGEDKSLALIQVIKGHPVHHIVQLGFLEKAKELGYKAEVVGTDDFNDADTVSLGEASLAKGAKGFVVWAHVPAYYPLIKRIKRKGGYSVVPHFPIEEGAAKGLDVNMSADPYKYGQEVAKAMGAEIGRSKTGKVAVSQGGFNTTENLAAKGFIDYINENFSNLKALEPIEEGFDAPVAISRAVALIQANPDLLGAFSTTGAGPLTWSGAKGQTGRSDLVAVGMDYTEQNLDLVKSGKIFAIVAQPLYEEAQRSVIVLDKLMKGEEVPYFIPLKAPVVTAKDVDQYSDILKRVKNFDFSNY